MSEWRDPATEGAWAYEDLHVNALFRQWAEPVLDAAAVTAGESVLDVACGTGVLARTARARVGSTGSVTGLDVNPGMLAVARSIEPEVTWVEGDAAELPFEDGVFDAVACQFGLMFFPDPAHAVREMLRCVKPGGRVAVAVWESLERSQAYPISVQLLNDRAGEAAADALRAPFRMGDTDLVRAVFERAGAPDATIDTQHRDATFPSIRSMVEADLRGWLPVMGVHLTEDVIESLLAEAEEALGGFVVPGGAMVFDAPAHIVSATRTARGGGGAANVN